MLQAHRSPAALDGFSADDCQAFSGFRCDVADRFYGVVGAIAARCRVDVDGVDRLPPGRVLLVANHAFGFDAAFAIEAIRQRAGRTVWTLGEHAWWRFPLLRRLAAGVGVVDGTPANVDRLLQNGEIVLVLPGGLREAMKPRELRYRLLWGQRYGFVRAAIRNQAPMLPLAGIGADDVFDLVGDAFERGLRWTGRKGVPVPRPAYGLPIPHFARLRYVFGEAIETSGADAQDDRQVRRLRHEVEGALQELLDLELARRAGIRVA